MTEDIPESKTKKHKKGSLIPLSEAESLFGWSRDWWQKHITSGKLLSTPDESSGRKRHLIRFEDAESLARDFPFDQRKEGVGRPRQNLRSNLRKRDTRASARSKKIEEEGYMLIQVLLSPAAFTRFEQIRIKLGSATKKAGKGETVEHLIMNFPVD